MGRIVAFWQETVSEPVLRAQLVTAEAGTGKSRMVGELLPQIERQGGAVVHIRFYPDSSLAIAPLASRALSLSKAGTELLQGEPEASIGGVIASLRRISHLRPTLLVLEDIHLLEGEPLRELQRMLQAISDQSVALLLLARPEELASRGVFEPFLVEEFPLKTFEEEEIGALLTILFGSPLEPWFASMLRRITLGVPLAIRSALRSLISSGAIEQEPPSGLWRTMASRESLEGSMRRSVELLSEGMIAHLLPDERAAAEQLASLGEVFAIEGARQALPDADRLVEFLLFRGVLFHLSLPVSPIFGSPATTPLLAFSHTLLHRRLAEREALDVGAIMDVIESGASLYSILPVQSLGRRAIPEDRIERIPKIVERLLDVTDRLTESTDWQLIFPILDTAERLFEMAGSGSGEETILRIELRIVMKWLAISARNGIHGEYQTLLDRFIALTQRQLPAALLDFRIHALRYQHLVRTIRSGRPDFKEWSEVAQLVEAHPKLRFTDAYILFLRTVADSIMARHYVASAPDVERTFNELLAFEEIPERLSRIISRSILPRFAVMFSTPEELDRRLRLLEESEDEGGTNGASLALRKIRLKRQIGRIDEASALIPLWLPRLQQLGLYPEASEVQIYQLCDSAGFGNDLGQILEGIERVCESTPQGFTPRIRAMAVDNLLASVLLCSDIDFARTLLTRYPDEASDADAFCLLLFALLEGDRAKAESILRKRGEELPEGTMLARILDPASGDSEPDVPDLCALMKRPLLRLRDILRLHLLLHLLGDRPDQEDGDRIRSLRKLLHDLLDDALSWLAERGLGAYMLPLVQHSPSWLSRREIEKWRARVHAMEQERHNAAERRSTDQRLRLRMIGAIEVEYPEQETVAVRGARLRALLGLMVADRMLEKPLGHREFCRIASGDDDPEHARKTTNGAVLRLREIIGVETVLTDQETPRLNPAVVRVDILDALDLCEQAVASLRNRQLMRAWPAMRDALDLWNGGVPFPALYDNFFEAARDDFENRMRDTTLKAVRALLNESDPTSAEELLRRAAAVMPGDTEIAELLAATLAQTGRRTEAERLKMEGKSA
jgi:DNA-binding SARP family transcriptional activator